jgi:hypothetical protein
MSKKAGSGESAKRREVKRETLANSPARVPLLTSAEDPPPYGAQHRRDALWKGEQACYRATD